MISAAARSSSMPSMSVSSSVAMSARSSRVTHAARGEREGGGLVHAVQLEQVVRRLVLVELLLGRQRLVEQRVAGTRAQLLDDVLVEALDREQLADRHVGDFLDRAEAFGHQDAGDFLVDLELVLEQLARGGLLGLATWR